MRWLVAMLAVTPLWAEEVEAPVVPSGQVIALYEVLREPGVQRWRFLASDVRAYEIDAVLEDMAALCETFVLPRLDADGANEQIVVSLMEHYVPFGESDPDARQHFEAFRVEGDRCIWELF